MRLRKFTVKMKSERRGGATSLTSEQRGKLLGAIKEMDKSLTRSEGEREYVREATKRIAEELNIDKKSVRSLVKIFHKQNFSEEQAQHKELEMLYQQLVHESGKATE